MPAQHHITGPLSFNLNRKWWMNDSYCLIPSTCCATLRRGSSSVWSASSLLITSYTEQIEKDRKSDTGILWIFKLKHLCRLFDLQSMLLNTCHRERSAACSVTLLSCYNHELYWKVLLKCQTAFNSHTVAPRNAAGQRQQSISSRLSSIL